MLALVASPNSPEHVEIREAPDPDPGPDQALVAVKSISLNRGEMNRLASAEDGRLWGWDLAGVVERPAPNGEGPRAGARVVGFVVSGAWAQKAAVQVERLGELPDEISFAQASAIPVAGVTALRILRVGGPLLGKRVLVTGASGGVGRFAVQLASLGGAHVTGIAGSEERALGLSDLGADEVVVGGIENARGEFDLILESVGGSCLAHAFSLVAHRGTIVTFGNSSRSDTTFSINSFYPKAATLVGFSFLRPDEIPGTARDLTYLATLIAEGKLDPEIGYEGDWRQAAEALQALRERKIQGKAVLNIGD